MPAKGQFVPLTFLSPPPRGAVKGPVFQRQGQTGLTHFIYLLFILFNFFIRAEHKNDSRGVRGEELVLWPRHGPQGFL